MFLEVCALDGVAQEASLTLEPKGSPLPTVFNQSAVLNGRIWPVDCFYSLCWTYDLKEKALYRPPRLHLLTEEQRRNDPFMLAVGNNLVLFGGTDHKMHSQINSYLVYNTETGAIFRRERAGANATVPRCVVPVSHTQFVSIEEKEAEENGTCYIMRLHSVSGAETAVNLSTEGLPCLPPEDYFAPPSDFLDEISCTAANDKIYVKFTVADTIFKFDPNTSSWDLITPESKTSLEEEELLQYVFQNGNHNLAVIDGQLHLYVETSDDLEQSFHLMVIDEDGKYNHYLQHLDEQYLGGHGFLSIFKQP